MPYLAWPSYYLNLCLKQLLDLFGHAFQVFQSGRLLLAGADLGLNITGYAQACKMAGEALTAENSALAEKWTKIQDTCFKQARACANDMGMTITSRCRLVLPEGAKKKEKNPFEQMMEERMRRA